ncbi:MAG: alkaline phosphatase family protein [Actinobacteria bacterium]|nr:alkaline phosphatase family protein [Actinomycetota bacterium]
MAHHPHDPDLIARTVAALLDPALEPIVEMVITHSEGVYEARAVDGFVRFVRQTDGSGWSFEVKETDGRSPIADQAIDRFSGLEAELANRFPPRTDNAYPFAYEQISQLFDAVHAPDVCVIHTAAHNWEDHGGHRGEHGSLDAVQARAPFIAAGKGVRSLGMLDRGARLVDTAPTICALLGTAPTEGQGLNGELVADLLLARQDGEVLAEILDPGERPSHVVGFLLDGANPNVLYSMANRGDAPNVRRLMDMGTTLRYGAVAGLPTVTLANHTTNLTGAYPGHHQVLHNAWYDRHSAQQVITNSPLHWPTAMQWLADGIESVHGAVRRTWPEAFTASVNEPCDIGAGYSTFDFFRRGEVPPIPESPHELPHVTERFVRPVKEYRWSSIVDHLCVEQAEGLWSGHYRGVSYPIPRFMWVNFTLTDSAFHAGGPHSEIAEASVHDTDARIGDVLAAVERAGAFDDTAFVLVADHGMEETNPEVTGDWDAALRDAGIPFRDEGYGFLYVGDDVLTGGVDSRAY